MNFSSISKLSPIFNGVSEKDWKKLSDYLQFQEKKISSGETILAYQNHLDKAGILLSGGATLIRYDQNGNRSLLDYLTPGGLFGEMFCASTQPDKEEVSLVAEQDSVCLFFSYEHLLKPQHNPCSSHSIFLANTLHAIAEQARSLSARIEILSGRTLRQKLMNYFEIQAQACGSPQFRLSFTLNSLADFLCIDRSAMLREMKKLREEELIDSKGREIKLLNYQNPMK